MAKSDVKAWPVDQGAGGRIAELEEMVAVLRQALQQAPARHLVEHPGYDRWFKDVREPALEVTK